MRDAAKAPIAGKALGTSRQSSGIGLPYLKELSLTVSHQPDKLSSPCAVRDSSHTLYA